MISLPEWYEPKKRNFPRFSPKSKPRCPRCGRAMKMERQVFPHLNVSTTCNPLIDSTDRQTRKVWKCPIRGCHFVQAESVAWQLAEYKKEGTGYLDKILGDF